MTAHVISHRGARGKRDAWQRFAAIAVAMAAVAWASWQLWPHARALPAPLDVYAPPLGAIPLAAPVDIGPAIAPEPRAHLATSGRSAGIPLDAAGEGLPADEYDVLNAAELAAISQAREEDRASQFAP